MQAFHASWSWSRSDDPSMGEGRCNFPLLQRRDSDALNPGMSFSLQLHNFYPWQSVIGLGSSIQAWLNFPLPRGMYLEKSHKLKDHTPEQTVRLGILERQCLNHDNQAILAVNSCQIQRKFCKRRIIRMMLSFLADLQYDI